MLFNSEQIYSMQIWAQATGTVTGESWSFWFLVKEKIGSDN